MNSQYLIQYLANNEDLLNKGMNEQLKSRTGKVNEGNGGTKRVFESLSGLDIFLGPGG